MIVVVCPAGAYTGGPEALHQLVNAINNIEPGYGAICYYPFEHPHDVLDIYAHYQTPVIMRQDIPNDALVVLPEIYPHLAPSFEQRCCIWWLSVNNYGIYGTDSLESVYAHLVQSEYARLFVISKYDKPVHMLTDYINDVFTPELDINPHKGPHVVVNPKKGAAAIQHFNNLFPHIPTAQISGMVKEQVHDVLRTSMVYIDFGDHPGRDRIPREACLSGTVVFSTKVNAAENEVDLPIDDYYKFSDITHELAEKVLDVFNDYTKHRTAQLPYLQWITTQKETFYSEVKNLIALSK